MRILALPPLSVAFLAACVASARAQPAPPAPEPTQAGPVAPPPTVAPPAVAPTPTQPPPAQGQPAPYPPAQPPPYPAAPGQAPPPYYYPPYYYPPYYYPAPPPPANRAAPYEPPVPGQPQAAPGGNEPPVPTPGSQPVAARPRKPVAIAIFTEAALGMTGDGFYNHLAGARFDYRVGKHLGLGAALGYVNLKGANGRVHNVLPALMAEWYVPVRPNFGLPLRAYAGYLAKNGPWLKAAFGLSGRLSDHVVLTVEGLAPTLWVVRDTTVTSFDLSVELAFEL